MLVTFSEVIGMEELNDGKPRKVRNCKVCPTYLLLSVSPCALPTVSRHTLQQSMEQTLPAWAALLDACLLLQIGRLLALICRAAAAQPSR
jgi:hypothetical protein